VALGSIFSVALTRLSGGSVEGGSVSAAPIAIGLMIGFVLLLFVLLILRGFRLLRHDQALVLSSHGRYLGTIRGGGLIWTNPFVSRRKVALHTHRSTVQHPFAGMHSATADVSWKVTDTSKAINVAHYDQSVKQAIEDSLGQVGAQATPEQFNTALAQHLGEIGVTSTKVEVRSGRIAL
jgi:regulator of protease activity HflC (stomatin/prohibitin superfamily)